MTSASDQHPQIYAAHIEAGFPSPADDHSDSRLDLPAMLVRRPAATFYVRASGPSMQDVGVMDGDLLVVDRSIPPQDGDIVVATLDGGMTVKRLAKDGDGWTLMPANPEFPPLPVNPEEGVQIWGVVTYSITALCPR